MFEDLKKMLFGEPAHAMSTPSVMTAPGNVVMYSTRFCPYCMQAKALLKSKGVDFEDIAVDSSPGLRAEMMEKANSYTVPQIWIRDEHIGGCDELYELERRGQLDDMLMGENNE